MRSFLSHPKSDETKQAFLRFSQNMVGDKTNIAFDSKDMRHSHKFNDLQSTCHSPELEKENESLRDEVANLKREMVSRVLTESATENEKTKMLERKCNELLALVDSLKLENKKLLEQSQKIFENNINDLTATEQEEFSSAAGDSPCVRSKISHKLEEKAVSGLVGIVDLPNKKLLFHQTASQRGEQGEDREGDGRLEEGQ